MNPWMSFEQAHCFLENQCNCEFIYDALIRQPSAFWSSLSFFLAGILLLRKVKVMNLWIGLIFIQGIASHLAHGTFTRAGLALDMASIVVLISLHAFSKLTRGNKPLVTLSYFVAIYFLMYFLPKWWLIGVCVSIFLIALLDLGEDLKDRQVQKALGVLIISFGPFMLDELKVFCEPQSFFQLHSLWHVGAAYALYLFGSWRFQARPAVSPIDCRSDTKA